MSTVRNVFVNGGTGYMGRALIAALVAKGARVRALARPGSERKLPSGCEVVIGNALDAATFASALRSGETFIHLVGVAHPSLWKAQLFHDVDLAALKASAAAAEQAAIGHFIYVSVARPAPVMRAYQQVRAECEEILRLTGIPATILRPWYVLGPGHHWPYALVPFYKVLERIPATRDGATRLGLVTLDQMVTAMAAAVETPPVATRIWEVPQIRSAISVIEAQR